MNDIEDLEPETAANTLRPFFRVTTEGALEMDTSFRESSAFVNRARINAIKHRSVLVSLAAERYNVFQQTRGLTASPPASPAGLRGDLTLCTDSPLPQMVRNLDISRRLIGEMAALCQSRGVDFGIMTNATAHTPALREKYKGKDPSFSPDFFDRSYGQLADSLGAGYIGLQSAMSEHHERHRQPLHWGHWNYTGNRVVAMQLEKLILARLK